MPTMTIRGLVAAIEAANHFLAGLLDLLFDGYMHPHQASTFRILSSVWKLLQPPPGHFTKNHQIYKEECFDKISELYPPSAIPLGRSLKEAKGRGARYCTTKKTRELKSFAVMWKA
jgi:hypothetical protein